MSNNVRFIHAESHRACVGCATAKTKCVPSSDTDGTITCERCHRLKKECVVVPKPDRKRKRSSTRQAALEEKVDEIVALLGESKKRDVSHATSATAGELSVLTPGAGPGAGPGPVLAPAPATAGPSAAGPAGPSKAAQPPGPAPARNMPRTCSVQAAALQDIGISDEECADALNKFITEQSLHCPWVDIPKGTTVAGLREQKPLLFLAVMLAASYHDFAAQQRICKIALHHVSDQLIVHGNKSIALLQGLLVLLNWYQSQFLNPQATVTNLLHLSIALTTDLGLNQNPASLASQRLLHHSLMSFMNGARRAVQPNEQTPLDRKSMDDRRALLGTFYIVMGIVFNSSPTSSHAMGWSQQLEEAAVVLQESGLAGNRADLRLAKMARLQQINAEIDHLQRELTLADKPLTSLSLYIKPFEARLEQYWNEMPLDFRQDNSFLLSYHATYRNLYKICLLDIGRSSMDPSSSSNQTVVPTMAPAMAAVGNPDTLSNIALQETRHRCLRSVCACMDVFFAVPPAKLFAMPLVFYAQIGLAMITLARLKFSVPDPWTSDLPPMADIVSRLVSNLEQAMDASSRAEGKDVRNNRLAQWAAWVRILEGAVTAGIDTATAANMSAVATDDATLVGVAAEMGSMPGVVGAAGASMFAPAGMMANGADPALAGLPSEPDLMETDWSALLDDMCGYGLFGYTDDGALQGVLGGFDGAVQPGHLAPDATG